MKLNLLKPYPREIFFSWVSRNYLMLGIDQTNFLELLFGKKMITLYSIMPFKDENIEEDREQYLDIVEHNSILTILRPFITTRDYNKVIEGRELNNIRTTIRGYKICPMCYQEDMQKYGETYLRIDHQVEDNYVCHIHQIDLVQIEDYKAEREIKLFEQNNIKSQLQIRHEYKEQIYNEISEMLYEIANEERISCISVEDTQKKYYNRVKELGYYKASEVAQRKLAADIRNYYGEEILSKLGCVINDRGQDDNWVKRLLANTTRRNISPLYHILMIKFLFGNLSNFVDYNKEYMPFGKGPWKCINPVCEKYDEFCIENVTLLYGKKEGEIRGKWQCRYCGMKYSKTGPEQVNDNFYENVFVIEHGAKWEKRLMEICSNHIMTLEEIADNMQCRVATVKWQIQKLNIARQLDQQNIEGLLIKAKDRLLQEIEDVPDIDRQELMNKHRKEYLFLLENDREWINNCESMPKYSISIANNTRVNEIYWEKKDKEMESVVKRIVEEILNANLPIRITLRRLIRETRYYALGKKKYMERLPRTRAVIEQYKENVEQYKRRVEQVKK